MKIACVLMAAGLSSRFPVNKLLFEIGGLSLFERAARSVPPGLFCAAVVVTAYEEIAQKAQSMGYTAVMNTRSAEGLSRTIALGLKAVGQSDACLFAVCDQPYLKRETVERLVAAHRPGGITALGQGGDSKNPVIFSSVFFGELSSLAPGESGKAVIARHRDVLKIVEADGIELMDVDRLQDLKNFIHE